jgi:hypothetical protein
MKKAPDSPLIRTPFLAGLIVLLGLAPGCVQVKTEPIRIEPIYIEITINHRVQKELDDLFADIDQASDTADYAPVGESEPQPES